MEDTIFDPWGAFEREESARVAAVPASPGRAIGHVSRARRWGPRPAQQTISSTPGPLDPRRAGKPAETKSSLADLVRGHLGALSRRLCAARHGTTITDRVHDDPSTIRLRIEPWASPLTDRPPPERPELEFIFTSSGQGLRVRTWVGSSEPLEEADRMVPVEDADRHIRGVLLDFVALALG
jgi:hypothetical protein